MHSIYNYFIFNFNMNPTRLNKKVQLIRSKSTVLKKKKPTKTQRSEFNLLYVNDIDTI